MRYRFDLDPAPIATDIARIAALAGVNIATSRASLLGGKAPAIHLEGTVDDALSALLKGTQARAIRIGSAAWRIVVRDSGPTPHSATTSKASPASIELIVLGSKRDQRLSNYPASATVIDGAALGRFGAPPDAGAIALADPALQSTHLGPGRDKFFLRGIADSSFNGSGAALVGLYINDLRLIYNAPDPNLRLYDVSRVEILEGAQGTLYGAGSMAGLIRITPRVPEFSETTGEIWAGVTTVAHGALGGDAGGVANIPIVDDRAALRLVAYTARDGGYIDSVSPKATNINETRTTGARAMLRVRISEGWLFDLGGVAQNIHARDAQYSDRGLPVLVREGGEGQPSSNELRAGYMVLSGPIGRLQFTSTSGVVHQALDQLFLESGYSGGLYSQKDRIRLLSEEARLSSGNGGRIDWVTGLSALSSDVVQTRTLTIGDHTGSLGAVHSGVTDLTAFGELTVHLTPRLGMTGGGRMSYVRLSGKATGALAREQMGDKLPALSPSRFIGVRHEHFAVPSFGSTWLVRPSLLLFVRYSEGYRPGGLTASGVVERYEADGIDSLEAGLRLMPGSSRLSAQLSGVTSWWHDVQADLLDPMGLPVVRNVGNARVHSLNANLRWHLASTLEARLAFTIASGTVAGRDPLLDETIRTRLPNVAHDVVSASLYYRRDRETRLPVSAGFQIYHVGHSVLGSGSNLSTIRQGGYWLLSTGVEVRRASNTISLDVDNLLDSAADRFAFGRPAEAYDGSQKTPLRPRTVRLGVSHHF